MVDAATGQNTSPGKLPRRAVLQALGAAGVSAGAAGVLGTASASPATDGWRTFGRRVRAEFERMGLVGAAVAVVSRDRVLHTEALGVRGLCRRQPITNSTKFLVASTTKSMSALLVATHVDDGTLHWDERVIDAWSGFRAPTDQLTKTMKVRDLLGMASGLGEPPALSALHEGDPTAAQLLQSVVNLPVVGPRNTIYFYNNTVYSLGGYLPLLRSGAGLNHLTGAYAREMVRRVYRPVGMTDAVIADDPRGVTDNYANGHGLDLAGRPRVLPYGAVGSYAPAGGTLASLDEMAAYVRLQLRRGLSVGGRRVVSAENLAQCWRPHIAVEVNKELDPSVDESGYGMGWIRSRFKDGTSLVWHNGGIDGFTSYIGFLPERDIGLVVLNAMNPNPTGAFFYLYVLNLLLSERFGLNSGVAAKIDDLYVSAMTGLRAAGRQSRPVDLDAVVEHFGHYERGYVLEPVRRDLVLRLGSRALPLRAHADGDYVIAGGLLVEVRVKLDRDVDGTPTIELVELETVRRTVGLP
jgi:CubicO group peptidase (beta-lactamase class C family)